MGSFRPSDYVPLWELPAAPPAQLTPALRAGSDSPEVVEERHTLNRLQRSLIWFAAVLIAVSMFENIRNNF